MEIEGENVQTMAVPRGSETSFHTKLVLIKNKFLLLIVFITYTFIFF